MPGVITIIQIGVHSKANDRPGLGMAALIVSRADAFIAMHATTPENKMIKPSLETFGAPSFYLTCCQLSHRIFSY